MGNSMQGWFIKNFGDAMLATESLGQLEKTFQLLYEHGNSPDAAVFTRLESEGHLHCELVAYLSPAAQTLARTIEAEPCDPPSPAGLDLLVGSKQSWQLLFPERRDGRGGS